MKMQVVALGVVALAWATGCSTVRTGTPLSAAGLHMSPVMKVEAALLATEAAALRQDLSRLDAGLQLTRTRIARLTTALSSTGLTDQERAQLLGERDILLVAAAGLQQAKGQVDQLVAPLPDQDQAWQQLRTKLAAEQKHLQKRVADLALEVDTLREAANTAVEIPGLREQLIQAQAARQQEEAAAREREQQVRAEMSAGQVLLQEQVAALSREVEALRPKAPEAEEQAGLRKQIEQIERQRQREQEIAAEREKQIRSLRDALAVRDDQVKELMAKAAADIRPAAESAPAVPTPEATPESAPPVAAATTAEPVPAPAAARESVAEMLTAEEPAAPELTAVQKVAAANVALQQGNLARAVALFRAALQEDDTLVGARIGLAACAYSMDDRETARKRVDEVLATDARNAQALGLSAILNWREGRMVEADDDSARAIASSPQDPQLRNYRGIILHAMGRHSEAAVQMRQAVKLDPGYGEAMLNLAVLLASTKPPDVAGAVEWYQKALALGVERDEGLDRLMQQQQALP